MDIINKKKNKVVSTIITNHGVTLDEALSIAGAICKFDAVDNWIMVDIDGTIYDYDALDIRG